MPSIDVPDPDQLLEGVLLDTLIDTSISQSNANRVFSLRSAPVKSYNRSQQVEPDTAAADIREAAWRLVRRLLVGRYPGVFKGDKDWAVRCIENFDHLKNLVTDGEEQTWVEIVAALGIDPAIISDEQWWGTRAHDRYDSRPGHYNTFPKLLKSGVYLFIGFLDAIVVSLYIGRSIYMYNRLTGHLKKIFDSDDGTLIYQSLKHILEQGGYFQVIPAIIITDAITSQAESDAVAVAEGYASGVLGTFRLNKTIVRARAEAGLPVVDATGGNARLPLDAPYNVAKRQGLGDNDGNDGSDDEADNEEADDDEDATAHLKRGAYLQDAATRAMTTELGQLYGRLNSVLTLLLFPAQAAGLVIPPQHELEAAQELIVESTRRLRAEIRTRHATLFASNDYEAAIRKHAVVLNYIVATVRVPKRFVLPHHKADIKSLFFHITLGPVDSRRNLFVALPPILRAKFGGIKIAIRREGGAGALNGDGLVDYWQEQKFPWAAPQEKLANVAFGMLDATLQQTLEASAAHVATTLANAPMLVYPTTNEQAKAAAASMMVVKSGVTILARPSGVELNILNGQAAKLLDRREGAAGP